jgi:hypothetical protein
MGVDVICLAGATLLAPDCPTGRAALLSRGGTARRCCSAPCFLASAPRSAAWPRGAATRSASELPGSPLDECDGQPCRQLGLGAAMRDGVLSVNPSDKADPPSVKAVASPETRFWSATELRVIPRPAGRRSGRADGHLDAVGLHEAPPRGSTSSPPGGHRLRRPTSRAADRSAWWSTNAEVRRSF